MPPLTQRTAADVASASALVIRRKYTPNPVGQNTGSGSGVSSKATALHAAFWATSKPCSAADAATA